MADIQTSQYNKIDKFKFWTQKILPLVYDDTLSYYETLEKVVAYLNDVIDKTNTFVDVEKEVSVTIQGIETTLTEIKEAEKFIKSELDKVKNGDYVSLYLDSISSWINDHLIELVGKTASFIIFGLNDDGYFVAFIPQSWDFIQFDTIADYNDPNFGRLILEY